MALLEIEDLSVVFRTPAGEVSAVRDLSLSLDAGETLALVGESGSGKSVTSLALLRLLPENAVIRGALRFEGRNLLALSPPGMRRVRGRDITMVFQEPMTALNPAMTIGAQVAEAVLAHNPALGRRAAKARTLEALHDVALPHPERRYDDYPHQFSGGQRQRILIAMAIVNRPKLLIADEPTTALDVTVQAQILSLLARLRDQYGLAMLFISHDLSVVAQVAERIAILRRGELLEQGTRDDIFFAAKHPYTRELLAAVPTMATDREQPLASVANS